MWGPCCDMCVSSLAASHGSSVPHRLGTSARDTWWPDLVNGHWTRGRETTLDPGPVYHFPEPHPQPVKRGDVTLHLSHRIIMRSGETAQPKLAGARNGPAALTLTSAVSVQGRQGISCGYKVGRALHGAAQAEQ